MTSDRNRVTDHLIIEKAIDEIHARQFGTTAQLLAIHQVVQVNNEPQVLRVDTDDDATAIVYFPLQDQRFYLAVWLDTEPEICVRAVGTESDNDVFLKVVSDDLIFDELACLTTLQPVGGWSKGEPKQLGQLTHSFTALHFRPTPQPDAFADKLRKLLDFLETDRAGLGALMEKAYVEVAVVMTCHNGNTMLGGPHLDQALLQRLAALNLAIDFDICAEGNFFKD